MSTVDVERLRNIAETVRQLPSFYHARSIAVQYFKRVSEGAKFIREAERLGAFQGDSIYGRIGKKLAHPSCHMDQDIPTHAGNMPAWRLPVWYAVVDTLAPELIGRRSRSMVIDANGKQSMRFDTSPEEAEIVARAIEAEADRLEASVTTTSPKLRVKVHAETKVVEIDGTPYPLSGSDKRKQQLVEFIQALIEAKGAPVSATDYGIRSRDVECQHDKIKSLIGDDAKPGSGHRIPLEKLMA